MVFSESVLSEKAVELAMGELVQFAQNGETSRLLFLNLVGLFIQKYSKSLTMEAFVATAGHKLASTNSESGDWFFEELKSLYANQRELVTISAKIAPELMSHLNLQESAVQCTM